MLIYAASSPLKNLKEFWLLLLHDVIKFRFIAWRLLISRIRSRYRQSILGWVWALFPPLITMLVFVFLQSQNVLKIDGIGVPYPVYVLTGVVLWQGFVDAVRSPLNILWSSQAIIAKTQFPREALVMSAFGEVVFNFLIRLIMLLLVFFWFEVSLSASIVLALLWAIILLIQGFAIGLLLAPISLIYQDFRHAVEALIPFWFLLTPIAYSQIPGNGLPSLVARLNPVTPLLVTARDIMIGSANLYYSSAVIVGIVSLVLLLISITVFRVAMPHVVEHTNT